MLSSSLRENGKGEFEGDKISKFTVSTISSEVSVGVEKRHSLESSLHGGSNDTPLVVVESVRQNIRGLECVGLGDLIIDVVLDAVAVSVASNALLLRRFFVRVEWKVSLAWSDG